MRQLIMGGLLAAATLIPGLAMAEEHLHEGDVIPSVVAGKITVTSSQTLSDGGFALFEGDFGDLIKGPYKTSAPGFNTLAFAPSTIVNYSAVGSLKFWDGLSWSSTLPANEYVRLDGNLGEDTRWNGSGVTGDATGLLGQADGGELHEHLDFSVARVGGGVPSIGAYMVGLSLSATGYTSSDPFYLVFNRGLSMENFETSVEALTSPVPEPSTWLLACLGLAAVGASSVKRRLQA